MENLQQPYQELQLRLQCLQLARDTGESDPAALVSLAQRFYDFVKANAVPAPTSKAA